jgi:RNA recognition motif-containing protein
MSKKIYVGNLSFDTNDEKLNALFATYGHVTSANVIMDRLTGRSRGFGFVEMENNAEADKAIAELNGKDVDGRALKVSEAQPREDKPRGGGGFGGGGGGGYGGGGGGGRRGGGGGRDRF